MAENPLHPDLFRAAAIAPDTQALNESLVQMLTGLPVVATAIPGPRAQVVGGETGFLVPPATTAPLAAALQRLMADPALRARMGAAGRARAVALYDEAAVLARTLDLLGL